MCIDELLSSAKLLHNWLRVPTDCLLVCYTCNINVSAQPLREKIKGSDIFTLAFLFVPFFGNFMIGKLETKAVA